MVNMARAVGEQRGHGGDFRAYQVAHRDGERGGRGAAKRQPGDGTDMVFELAGHRPLDRPMAAVVDARRHLVKNRTLVGGEKFAGEDAHIVEIVGDPRHQRAGLVLLVEDDLRRGQRRGGEDAILVDIDAAVPEARFTVDAAD